MASLTPCAFCGKPTHQVYGNAANTYPCCMACYSELPQRVQDYRLTVVEVKWQPIETAPKDGTPILGFAGGKQATVSWCSNDYEDPYWDLCVCGHYAEDGDWNPTHWMPLPEAPNY